MLILVGQDNAGENKSLEKRLRSADWKLHVTMENTANTPEQNAIAELKFAHLAARARVAMNAAKGPRNIRWELSLRWSSP